VAIDAARRGADANAAIAHAEAVHYRRMQRLRAIGLRRLTFRLDVSGIDDPRLDDAHFNSLLAGLVGQRIARNAQRSADKRRTRRANRP